MSKNDKPRADATRVVSAGRRKEWTGGVVNTPVWRASTILYDTVAEMRERVGETHHRLFYGRRGTPTQWSLADALTELEPGAEGTFLYPSGVAAIVSAIQRLSTASTTGDRRYAPLVAFAVALLAPPIFLDSAFWNQTDSWISAALVWTPCWPTRTPPIRRISAARSSTVCKCKL